LLLHVAFADASRTFCTAGNNKPIRIAMIAITTSNSISVKARITFGLLFTLGIITTLEKINKKYEDVY
jgi:hypothetical protein